MCRMSADTIRKCEKKGGKTCEEHNDGYYCDYCIKCLYEKEDK